MTADDFRSIALSFSGAVERSHFGNPDFRTGEKGRIFATLSLEREGYGVLMLTPDQPAEIAADEPAVFSPVPGGWGRNGSTRVNLAAVTEDVLRAVLLLAWRNKSEPPKASVRKRSTRR